MGRMVDKLAVGVIMYLIVMVVLIIPGLLETDWNIFKSGRRNRIVLKWYLILGNAIAISLAIFAASESY